MRSDSFLGAEMMPRERRPGSYLLLLELTTAKVIRVGQLGTFDFPAGGYVYIGSAKGGLKQRLSRHWGLSPTRRWHLDYLRVEALIRGAHLFPNGRWPECDLARTILSLPGASIPAPRFGASDCHCPAHLAHFPESSVFPYPLLDLPEGSIFLTA